MEEVLAMYIFFDDIYRSCDKNIMLFSKRESNLSVTGLCTSQVLAGWIIVLFWLAQSLTPLVRNHDKYDALSLVIYSFLLGLRVTLSSLP